LTILRKNTIPITLRQPLLPADRSPRGVLLGDCFCSLGEKKIADFFFAKIAENQEEKVGNRLRKKNWEEIAEKKLGINHEYHSYSWYRLLY
jgi:hypothetical protein